MLLKSNLEICFSFLVHKHILLQNYPLSFIYASFPLWCTLKKTLCYFHQNRYPTDCYDFTRTRAEALKRLAWFLSNETDSVSKLPVFSSLDVTNLTNIFIMETPRSVDDDLGRSVFQVGVAFILWWCSLYINFYVRQGQWTMTWDDQCFRWV